MVTLEDWNGEHKLTTGFVSFLVPLLVTLLVYRAQDSLFGV